MRQSRPLVSVEVLGISAWHLDATNLAILAQVCHFLRDQTRLGTTARRLDVSRGRERLGIRVNQS